jgi:hypothetical protein
MRASVAFVLGALLAGCGGGGSSNSASDSPVLAAEGVYTGTLSNGEKHESIILENGQIFMMHGDFQSLNGQAVLEGPGKAENGGYSSADLKDFQTASAESFFPASISASYNSAGRFSGTISEQGGTIGSVSFDGVRPTTSFYDYDQPASLDKVVGNWGDFLLRVTITPAGDIHLSSRQCDGNGTIKPRTTGKNVFDIEWTFGAIPACPFYGQTVKSIAFVEGFTQDASTLSQRLIIMGVDNSRAKGKGYFLLR